jgi:hypothetical protein
VPKVPRPDWSRIQVRPGVDEGSEAAGVRLGCTAFLSPIAYSLANPMNTGLLRLTGGWLGSRQKPLRTRATRCEKKHHRKGGGVSLDDLFGPPRAYCVRCHRSLPREAFRENRRLKRGLHSWCRSCTSAAAKEWREAHPEAVEAYKERQRLAYAERHREAQRHTCSECGEEFTGRADRKTCSPECRRRRKARLDTRWPNAA